MELAHDHVFEAAPYELFATLEDLRPDEAGNIVDMEPCALGLHLRKLHADRSAEAILSRLKHHHVDAVCHAVGEFRALPGLEVEAISFPCLRACIFQDLLIGDVEDLVAIIRSCEALEHRGNRSGEALAHLGLNVDVGEHAPGNDVNKLEGIDDILEGTFHRDDAVDGTVHRVGADDDVASRIGECVEDLPHDVVGVVGWRIRLNTRAHIPLGPQLGAGHDVEDLLADGDKLFVAHQFRHATDRIAGQPIHDAFDLFFRCSQEKLLQLAHGPVFDLFVLGLVRCLPDQPLQIVLKQRALVKVSDLRACQKGPGVRSRCVIFRHHPDRLISFLERVRTPQHLPIGRLVKTALDPADIGKDVLALLHLIDHKGASARCCPGSLAVCGERGRRSPCHQQEISSGQTVLIREHALAHCHFLSAKGLRAFRQTALVRTAI
ncbi:hypothetical protein D9M68_513880 [compost metagenome]